MSHESESTLARDVRIKDVHEFVQLLGYDKHGIFKFESSRAFEEYSWFDDTDYKSWSGVELTIYTSDSGRIVVSTRTTISRSYYDLMHQNRTISLLRKHFGGEFTTDEGRGRYLRTENNPPPAAASGCYLAFSRFGGNLIKAKLCHESRSFPNNFPKPNKRFGFLIDFDPRVVANNTLVPFLVATSEDYLKSTFIALLRYSQKREGFLRNVRLQGEQLSAIAAGKSSVEDQAAEMLSFQRISAVCRHFDALDSKLDLATSLRKPYRRRKESLFDSMENLVLRRHDFIHRAVIDRSLTDERIDDIIYDLEAALTRVYKRITSHYDWFFDKNWGVGQRRRKKELLVPSPHGILK